MTDNNTSDELFLEALAELAYSNPFSRERIELEQRALGQPLQPDDSLWSRTQATQYEERPRVRELTARADPLAEELRS